jgi:hypothetical protein
MLHELSGREWHERQVWRQMNNEVTKALRDNPKLGELAWDMVFKPQRKQ